MTTPDLALVGAMRWACQSAARDDRPLRKLLEVRMVEPQPAWIPAYRGAYERFLAAQGLLDGRRTRGVEVRHA